MPKLMRHDEDRAKRKGHSTKCHHTESGEISTSNLMEHLKKRSRTRRSKHTQEELTVGNNQTEGPN